MEDPNLSTLVFGYIKLDCTSNADSLEVISSEAMVVACKRKLNQEF